MTQDSDTRPEPPDEDVEGALDKVLEHVESAPVILSGEPVDVTLTIKVSDCFTPQEAVDQFMSALMRRGSDAVFFFIESEDEDERYAVKAGRLYDPDELLAPGDGE